MAPTKGPFDPSPALNPAYALLRHSKEGTSVIASAKTDSMEPTIRVGQEIRITRVRPSRIKPGDIIAYVRPGKPEVFVHRVVRRAVRRGRAVFFTKGDNVPVNDAYHTPAASVLGTVEPLATYDTRTRVPAWVRNGAKLALVLLCAELTLQAVDFGRYLVSVIEAKRDARDWYTDERYEEAAHGLQPTLTFRYHPFLAWTYEASPAPLVTVEPDGARHTVGNPGLPGLPVVYFFGGSTMWGLYANDDETIPSQVSGILNREHATATVVNYGHISYNSTQEVLYLLLRLREGKRPDVVVFYDGCNDLRSAPELVRSESAIRDALGDVYPVVFPKAARAYWTPSGALFSWGKSVARRIKIISYPWQFLKRTFGTGTRSSPTAPLSDADIVATAAATYRQNASVIDALSRGYGFSYLRIWQPTVYDKAMTPLERKYPKTDPRTRASVERMHRLLAEEADPHFLDLSDTFRASASSSLFADECHVTPEANAVIARRIAESLAPLVGGGKR